MSKRPLEATADPQSGKVAIPRRTTNMTTERREKQRVLHACEPCRQRKTKCDGARPTCSHCARLLIACQYQDGKRELQKRRLQELEYKVAKYENILQNLSTRLDPDELEALNDSLGGENINYRARSASAAQSVRDVHQSDDESDIQSEHSDTGDILVEDINSMHINRPTGFMGRGSEISWIRIVRAELGMDPDFNRLNDLRIGSGNLGGLGSENVDICTTYHLDDIDISLSSEHGRVDPYALPPREIADQLIHGYFDSVHPLFPIVNQDEFHAQYEQLFYAKDAYKISRHWMSVINLVFAIGQRYFETMGRMMDVHHLTFFMRARVLGALDGGALFGIPTMPDVQQLGLSGFYLLASKHTNRSWNVVGLALRIAQGLGLHIRTVDPALSDDLKEMRVRVWYSIVYLETTLCLVTARPSGLQGQDSTGPVPKMTDMFSGLRHAQNPDIYYAALMKLASIISCVQSQLYSYRTSRTKKHASQREEIMSSLEKTLRRWKAKLPHDLDFDQEDDNDTTYIRHRIDLGFRFNNCLILIHFHNLGASTVHPVDEFSRRGSATCVTAALDIMCILISHMENKGSKVPSQLAWWCLHHYLVCAEAVIMLKICQQTSPDLAAQPLTPNTPDPSPPARELLKIARKPLEWLRHVSISDLAAHRAQDQLSKLLDRIELRIAQFENNQLPPLKNIPPPNPSGSECLPPTQFPPSASFQSHQAAIERHELERTRDLLAHAHQHERGQYQHPQQVDNKEKQEAVLGTHGDEDRRWMQITMGPSPVSGQTPSPGSGAETGVGGIGGGGGGQGGFGSGWEAGRTG